MNWMIQSSSIHCLISALVDIDSKLEVYLIFANKEVLIELSQIRS